MGGGYGAENEKVFIKKNLVMEFFLVFVFFKIILVSFIKLDKGWGLGCVYKGRRE